MQLDGSIVEAKPARLDVRRLVGKYQRPDVRRSIWQIANSFVPFLILAYVMYLSLALPYWVTLLLALPTGGFLVRIFIIFHDCGHGSFFRSRRANDIVGMISGVFCFTPYHQWRHSHALHHASASNLDERGAGDIYTLTVKEYLALSRWGKLKYRLFRHPVVLLGIGPLYVFLIGQRFPEKTAGRRERISVYLTNLALLIIIGTIIALIGVQAYVMVHLPIMIVSATAGVWLFYVQHQFEDTYWSHGEEWDYASAALEGSSYLKLPKVLQWFTGNIGLHHVHHLSARIPNYYLQQCHDETPEFQAAHVITLRSSLKTLSMRLWDEEQRKMISFQELEAKLCTA